MQLTDEQIANWRRMLCLQFGPYALIMPREQIEAHADRMQELADKAEKTFHTSEKDGDA